MTKTFSLTKLSLALAVCYAGSQSALAKVVVSDSLSSYHGNADIMFIDIPATAEVPELEPEVPVKPVDPSLFKTNIKPANTATQVSQKGAVEIVDIARPSATGLSHNKYNQFDIEKAGAVLNNARHAGQSQLAGELQANPNLRTHSATVILNEVVSNKASTLAGKQEIFGQQADYILANPNGINANGAGFINTPRASLVVGAPKVENGSLAGYDVTGDNGLTTSGTLSSDGDIDLIAPRVDVTGDIKTSEGVNIIMGRNEIARDGKGVLTVTSSQSKGKVLDGKVAGGIHAGRIRIHSTDDRATITAEAAELDAQDIEIVAGNAKLQGKVTTKNTESKNYRRENYKNIHTTDKKSQQTYEGTKVKAEQFSLTTTNAANISGADIQAKHAEIIGGTVNLGTEKTVDKSEHTLHQSKGSWERNEKDQSRKETIHSTVIKGEDVEIVAHKGKVTASGAKISMVNGGIYGEQGVDLQGAKTADSEAAQAQFKRESNKLKTGSSSQSATAENYVATELNAKEDMIIGAGKGDIRLAGVTGKVDGDLLVHNTGKTSFVSEKTKEAHSLRDDHKFWGGLAGAKTVGSGRDAQTIHGTDLTVKGATSIDSAKGVTVSGSRVISEKDGVVRGNKGALVIDAVNAQTTETSESRKGTIFNITKARENSFKQTSTAKGSTLKSESNLQLSADKQISIVGSEVAAKGLLNIASLSGIDIRGAQNLSREQSSSAGFKVGAHFDSFTASFEKGHASATVGIDNKGGTPSVSSDVTLSANKKEGAISTEAKFGVGLNAYNNSSDVQKQTHTASQISGGSVDLAAKKVDIKGSQVNATEGDLSIHAKDINVVADKNHTTANNVSNNTEVGLNAVVTNKKVSTSLGVNVDHSLESVHATTAQVSQLSAQKNVVLDANTIKHQGTLVQAGENVQENAKQIIHSAAKEEANTFKRDVNVNVAATVGADVNKALSTDLSLAASGGREIGYSSNHKGTQISAGNNVDVTAHTLSDTATKYNAGGDANLQSEQHWLSSAHNETRKDSLSAGANVGVSASTSDFQKFNVGVNTGVNFDKGYADSTTAVQSSVNANNVNLNTGKLQSEANIHAQNNVNVQAAQSATFTQATNTASQSGGGFEVSANVGATVIPSASAALPSIDLSAKANGHKGSRSEAVANTISGTNVNVQSNGKVQLQGTNVEAQDNAHIAGQTVSVSATKGHVQNVAVNAGAGVNIGEKLSGAGFDANLGVSHENSTSQSGVNVNAQNVNIQAHNGIALTGVNSNSANLNLDAGKGDLNLVAAQSKTNKTDVGIAAALKGTVTCNCWTANSAGASLDVSTVRNETLASTSLNTDNATVNSAGNALLSGSAINANNIAGNVQGNLHTETLSNKVKETSVSLAANSNGKVTAYPADKWQESAKKDWENGSISGLQADAKVEVSAKRENTNTQAGVNAKKNNVVVKGQKTRNNPTAQRKKVVSLKASATTRLRSDVIKVPTAVQFQVANRNKLAFQTQVRR